ncbi:RNA-binding protein Pasilla isoform X3 [Drosophila nasuta]|uniref:RNA-binding protein Pasilla isoform X3 n=1 Tax=Drosophila nasuta TaxID=42062 RepID=UPI00295E7860|nr:RNA-binding protein Pasilla isoform X3 [Drosophila nasuta]XP_060649735.1 RNA-binding protein Pasilla isoform X3 [Drosophila nasuta]XP_060649736.1 RNA-binding protein Pasilla isoform X3 [Drosophila nasuta]XP_060649737.1 RNA-binding protein Pasilla isoform X3 [Drosophila nasuta]XP_060649738.1 RNA-binding protein Pasilla isoform X3 [Drosophila nasuta]
MNKLNAHISVPMETQMQQISPNANVNTTLDTESSSTAVQHHEQEQEQQLQHHHQHQHQIENHETTAITASFKTVASCWCYGESVCSGIEVEIENNNNNHNHHGDTTFHMKILVPAVASGAIIGKGGETIASLQKDTGARVKMSKSHDFYPGTTERVCLITGSVEGIMTVVDFIMDKIREKPDLTTKIIDAESKQAQERDKQVKILVPNSTAGMIIGKGGAFIKQIKEESGSYVQISQKPKDVSLQERCITIIGDKENNKNACKMILSKIVEDPQSGTCLNVSYADVNGPVANFNPTGSPYATNQNAINSSTASLNSTLGTTIGGAATAASLLVNGTGINLSLNLGAPNPAPNLAVATQLLEHIKVAMRGAGYSETVTTEVCAALGVLAKYGVLGMGVGVGVTHANGAHPTLGNYLGVAALDQQTAAAASAANASNVFGAVGQVNLEQYAVAAAAAAAATRPTPSQLEVQFDAFRHLGSATAPATTPVSLNNNSFGLTGATGTVSSAQLGAAASIGGLSKSPTPGDLGAKDSKNVEVPEVIIGAVLGPNGRSLVEIQHVSGANVQISKKGIFAPGTRNRIVTITGQPSAIAKAQYLIEQKINEEETKRARQIPLTTVVN